METEKTHQEEISQRIEKKLEEPWVYSNEEISKSLDIDPEEGLGSSEVKENRNKFGANIFKKEEKKSALEILVEQFKNLLVIILVIAAVFSIIFGELIDGLAIIVVIIINTGIGFYTELKATRSMEALEELTKITTKVRREGDVKEIDARDLVVGDILVFKAGDVISADARLLEASKLQVDESALTGESVPVVKSLEKLEGDVPLAERENMIYKGTAITKGSGEGIVIGTGEDTELGKISSLMREAAEGETPLTKRLSKLARRLFFLTIVIAIIVAIGGIISGKEIFLMIETSIALAIAAVPEGLPIVATISLARGMWRMADKNALVNRLTAVEALGSTNIICTDKTGTLTEDRMTVTDIQLSNQKVEISGTGLKMEGNFYVGDSEIPPQEHEALYKLIKSSVLCNNASLQKGEEMEESKFIGEPMEAALLIMGAKADIWRENLLEDHKEVKEVSFDRETKMMATYNKEDSELYIAVKGAPEAVLESSSFYLEDSEKKDLTDQIREKFLESNKQMGREGLRILGAAYKIVNSEEEEPYEDLIFLGLIGLLDPPREEVKSAIERCQHAGIQVIMITGDQETTAENVGKTVGIIQHEGEYIKEGRDIKDVEKLSQKEREEILKTKIFSRVSPEQKLNLVDIYQKENNVVAMTGDGVNDAPALRKANIGVAMGIRGTQVAKEAADMVLRDDDFETIADAVEEGRIISNNIRKFVIYLMSCNISEIMIIFVASLLNMPLPITPLQILYLNIVTDVFPALALAVGEGSSDIMDRPPRDPEEPIISRNQWIAIGYYGSLLTTIVLIAFFTVLSTGDIVYTGTIAFLTLGFSQLFHVFNMRNTGSNFIHNEITENKFVWYAILISTVLLLVPVYMPFISDIIRSTDPGLNGWLFILGMSVIPFIIGQLWSSFQKKYELI